MFNKFSNSTHYRRACDGRTERQTDSVLQQRIHAVHTHRAIKTCMQQLHTDHDIKIGVTYNKITKE